MPTNEEGEFELVLGNKQLLSVFFLVVLLLGVFFSMGYIVGRNTSPGASQLAQLKPIVVEPPAPFPTSGSTAPLVDPSKPSPGGPNIDPAKPEPLPLSPVNPEPPRAETKKAEPLKPQLPKTEPKKPEVVKAETKPPAQAPAGVRPAQAAKPAKGGTYLQVSATRPTDADALAQKLTSRGYKVSTVPVENSPLVRVLVGPLGASEEISRTREELQAAGFEPFIRRL